MANTVSRRHVLIGGSATLGTLALLSACTSSGPDGATSTTSAASGAAAPGRATTRSGERITVDDGVLEWTALEQLDAMDAGAFTSLELTTAYLARIERLNPELNAFVLVDREGALEAAAAADERRAAGDRTSVLGLCVGIKDIIDVEGLVTTHGSRIFADNVAAADAGAVSRLRDAGAVILGKVNTTEFAGSQASTEDGASINAWNRDRSPGGSSNGSATAVSTSLCSIAVGTDTAGSIRTPSSFQGVFGLKVTLGLVPANGTMTLSHDLDTVGPLARGVDDLALALEALAGYDPADPASVDRTAPDYLTVLSPATPPLTVGAPTSWFDDVLAGEVRTAWRTTLDRLGESGVAVRDVELPDLSTVGSIWLRLVASDSFAWHQATLASDPDGYTPAARGLFERGRTVTAVEVARAREERQALLVAMLDAMEGVDALILPTSAVPAPLTAEIATGQVTSDGRLISAANIGPTFMMPFNVTGQPALTVPVALSTERLPIAVQVVGRPFQEVTVLEVGKEVAAVMPVDLRPPLA